MAIEDDVLVIGGGLAGATAALSAARERPSADVRLLSHKQSTLEHATGLVDVLGYPPHSAADESPIVDPFEAIADCPDGHPYDSVGVGAVRDALAMFDDVVGDAYAGDHTDANALVPTADGTVKPTARYPASVTDGLASDTRPALLVGFETVPAFDAPLAASRLRAAGVPFDVRGVTISFPGDLRADAPITRLATALDRDESLATAAGTQPAREALASRIAASLDGETRVGLPAILGDERAAGVRRELAERLDTAVFEIPGTPPSLPGLRLEDQLYDALADAGVRVTTGVPVVDYESGVGTGREVGGEPSTVDRLLVDHGGRTVAYRAVQYVLATGGLVGKGLRSDREAVHEPIFDCHVPHPADRADWSREAAYGDHPFARFGVGVDRELRPLDADGHSEFDNLRAAGAVLGGADVAAELSAAGVSLATGHVAGTLAAKEVVA